MTQKVWKGLGERIKEFLNSITIEELASEMNSLKAASGHKCDAL